MSQLQKNTRQLSVVQDYMKMRYDAIWRERSTIESVSFTSSLTEAQTGGNA
ncbi:MAG TPA: hypothetical protein VEG44_00710 [Candidatus Acidoferrales bacterium]|nr:hypothetical protein [Candidatus Acidoferrales bacterium]